MLNITEFSALNSSNLTMKRDCGEQKSGYYGTATLNIVGLFRETRQIG